MNRSVHPLPGFSRRSAERLDSTARTVVVEQTVTVCSATTVRAVESCLTADRTLKSGAGWTDRFIYPPYTFRVTERLLTNFQLPRSTLLILVAAFGGIDLIRYAYEEAIREEYRLFAFGDAMLIV